MASKKPTTDTDQEVPAAEDAVEGAAPVSAKDWAAKVAVATGRKVTADYMHLVCELDGFAPASFYASSLAEAAEMAIATLCDEFYVPMPIGEAKPVVEPVAVVEPVVVPSAE